jgi:anti-sigma factor (TIGR02949 family)
MDCTRIRFFLNAFLDGELSIDCRQDVARHISSCPRCAARLESFRRVRSVLKDFSGRVAVPEDLKRRIFERRQPARGWRRVWRPAVGAAALCLLVIPVVADSITRPAGKPSSFAERSFERAAHGRLFCLRCAMQGEARVSAAALPAGRSHLAAFRSDDGQVWILLNQDACPANFPRKDVSITGRFFPANHLVSAESIQ